MREVRGSQGIEVTFGSSESTCIDPFQQCLELHRGSSSSVSSGAAKEDNFPPLQMADSGNGTADSPQIRKLRSYLDRMSFLGDNTAKGERQMSTDNMDEEREEDSTKSVTKLTSTKGIALLCSLAVTVALCLLLVVFLGAGKPKQKEGDNYLIKTPTMPSAQPSAFPSSGPSPRPSFEPSYKPSVQPSAIPSSQPSFRPSSGPTYKPSAQPSAMPSGQPSSQPSSEPSSKPSAQPSAMPSSQPSTEPSSMPSSIPSEYPSANPSSLTSTIPSLSPSNQPTSVPSAARPEITTVVITGNSSSAPLITVGAAAFMLLASAACYLRRRDNGSDDTLSLQCPTDGSDLVLGNSISHDDSSKKQDLEEGKREPSSAYNKFMAGNINNILSVVSMAEKFTRQRDGESEQSSSVANPEEDTPKACKPVRVISRLSPMFSPVREFSIKMNERKRRNLAAKNKSKSVLCLDSPPDGSILGYDMKKCISDSDSSEKVTKSSPTAYMNDGVKVKMEHGTEICETSLATFQHSGPTITAPSVDQEDSFQFKYVDDLINSSQEGGGFSFRDVYFDPENELYECHVSGSLGISVDATPLGLRVQKINPTSRLQNFISKGDIIVAVDDVDLVGQESSVFWKLASQKSDLCLVVLKI